jgi:hypothetical protein
MPQDNSLSTNQKADLRAKQIKATLRKLKRKIQKISSEGDKGILSPSEIIERMYVFKDVWNFQVIPAGWYPN